MFAFYLDRFQPSAIFNIMEVQGTDITIHELHFLIDLHAHLRGVQLRPTHGTIHVENKLLLARAANKS